jgi:hypothetical protein
MKVVCIAISDDHTLLATMTISRVVTIRDVLDTSGNGATVRYPLKSRVNGSKAKMCFVRSDALLIVAGHKIEEATVTGMFIRLIPIQEWLSGEEWLSGVIGSVDIAHSGNVIAVTAPGLRGIVLLNYATGEWMRSIYLASPVCARFTPDGAHLLVVDTEEHRVTKFTLTTGVLTYVVGRKDGLRFPFDIVCCEDDGIVVAYGALDDAALVHYDKYGAMQRHVYTPVSKRETVWLHEKAALIVPWSWWGRSLRCAWVTACVA